MTETEEWVEAITMADLRKAMEEDLAEGAAREVILKKMDKLKDEMSVLQDELVKISGPEAGWIFGRKGRYAEMADKLAAQIAEEIAAE